jgi:hypothetical protein
LSRWGELCFLLASWWAKNTPLMVSTPMYDLKTLRWSPGSLSSCVANEDPETHTWYQLIDWSCLRECYSFVMTYGFNCFEVILVREVHKRVGNNSEWTMLDWFCAMSILWCVIERKICCLWRWCVSLSCWSPSRYLLGLRPTVKLVARFGARLVSTADCIFDFITRTQSFSLYRKWVYVLFADESPPIYNKITFPYFYRNYVLCKFLFVIIVH